MPRSRMSIKDLLLELIFPSFCLNCRKLGPLLCQDCHHDLQFYFVQNKIQEIEKNFDQVYFDELQILAKFTGSLARIIKALKYQSCKNCAGLLAALLQRHLLIPQVDLVTFVPLHPIKLRGRGYNQGQEIALKLAKNSGIPVKNLLLKKENNQAQAQIKKQSERLQRMEGLFAIREKYGAMIQGKTILLIDDVLTTGATLNAVSKTLKAAGALKIHVLVLASKME